MSRGSAGGFPTQKGIQLTKEVALLNMREAAGDAALDKLWADTFKDSTGIDAGNSSGYSYDAGNQEVDKNVTEVERGAAGTMSASSGSSISNLNDANLATAAINISNGGWIKCDLGAPIRITKVRLYAHDNISYMLDDAVIQGSNNDSDWDTLETISNLGASIGVWEDISFINATAYRYYRLNNVQSQGEAVVYLTEFQLMEPASSSAILQSIQALDLAVDVSEVIVFGEVTGGTISKIEVSTDDGSTWDDITGTGLEEIAAVTPGAQIKLRLTFTGSLQYWGVAA